MYERDRDIARAGMRIRKTAWQRLAVIAFSAASAAAVIPVGADNGQPLWKIGRAVIATRAAAMAEPRAETLIVKLSLRNEGSPASVPVVILGRWRTDRGAADGPSGNGRPVGGAQPPPSPSPWNNPAAAPDWPRQPGGGAADRVPWGNRSSPAPQGRTGPPDLERQGFVRLGSYAREVALKRTAILVIPLAPLGAASGRTELELVVMTGTRETDRQVIYDRGRG